MLVPSIFKNNLFNDFFSDPFDDEFFRRANPVANGARRQFPLMNTDIKETDKAYELEIDLPGFDKEQIELTLEDGYLNIAAKREDKVDEQDENGKYIHRERYVGACSRKFFVGKQMTEEQIKAAFENGILKITVPKPEPEPVIEEPKKTISIEG